jgi:uncharacterized protein (TIGR00255 family)
MRARLERGRVEATLRIEGQTFARPTLDLDRARAVYGELAKLRDELHPNEPLPLALLASVPDLFVIDRELDEEAVDRALTRAAETACDTVLAMRQTEGDALATELMARLHELGESIATIEAALPELIETRRNRLRDRVDALLADKQVTLDPARLEQELAVLAERSDVAEELVRLTSHRAQMLDLATNSDGPVGKRIDFLLQEMSREANTIGSKVQDGTVTPHVIALKACIEQMREQAQNVL